MRRRDRRHRRGYTMIDLTMVVVLMAVSAAIAVPRYANAVANFRAAQAANRVAADLSLARVSGKTTSAAGLTVTFNVAAETYSLPGVVGTNGSGSTYTVDLSAEPYRANLVSAAFNGTAAVTFDRFGQPSSGGTVVVQVGAAVRTVTLDGNSGRTTIQ